MHRFSAARCFTRSPWLFASRERFLRDQWLIAVSSGLIGLTRNQLDEDLREAGQVQLEIEDFEGTVDQLPHDVAAILPLLQAYMAVLSLRSMILMPFICCQALRSPT